MVGTEELWVGVRDWKENKEENLQLGEKVIFLKIIVNLNVKL